MAEALSQLAECPICMEKYENPKVLPCEHTLCANCVEGVRRGSRVKCPMCNTVHNVASIKTDFRMNQLLDALAKAQNVPDSQAIQDSANEDSPTCELCQRRPVGFRCEDCEKWICQDCKTTHLRIKATANHCITTVASKFKEIKKKLKTQSSNVKGKISAQSTALQKIQDQITRLELTQTNALQVSDNLRKKSLKDVNDHYDSIDARIIYFIQTNVNQLEAEKKKLEKQLTDMKTKCERLEKMVEENAAQLAVEGNSILEQVAKLSDTSDVTELYIDEVEIQVLRGLAWDATTSAMLQLSGGEVHSSALNDTRLSTMVDKQFTQQKQVELKCYPIALRVIKQHLWSCQSNGVVQIHDERVKLVHTLSNSQWGHVWDITILPSGQLVLAGRGGLYHLRPSERDISQIQDMKQIDSNEYNSVVFYYNRVYAYTRDPPRVLIYTYSGSWHKQHTIPLPFKNTAYVTLSIANYQITACSQHDHKIVILSLSGQVLQTLGEHGSDAAGQLNRPTLCQQDWEAALMIADYKNNRLQVMDSRTRWSIVRMTPAVNYPTGAVLINNKLYVVSWGGGYKLSLYMCN